MTLRKEDIELVDRLTKQTPNHGAQDIFLYCKILEESRNWQMANTKPADFSLLLSRIHELEEEKNQPQTKRKWLVAASISLLLLAGAWLFHLSQVVSIEVPVAEMKTVWLPDSSKVILNASSILKYSKAEWENEHRSVDLKGGAYFEVKKGSKFEVSTDQGRVAVLGTSFNVKAFDQDFIVECITGKVAVSAGKEPHTVVLTPGLKVEKDQESELLIPSKIDKERSKEWLTGVFNFTNQPLHKVWREFERQFDVRVRYVKKDPRYYTGTFSNTHMTKALDAICKPMGLSYEIDSNNKLITINN